MIKYYDEPIVKLLAYTPDLEKTIALAARLCYSKVGSDELSECLDRDEVVRLLRMLKKCGHLSPFEHASFTFVIEGISRVCSHQLVRHRIASYSQQSQRYVGKDDELAVIVPPSIKNDPTLENLFKTAVEEVYKVYHQLIERMQELDMKSESIKEDVRFVLPQAVETKIIVTMNARELLHFFTLRCCKRAQWEIRQVAYMMLGICQNVAPIVFEDAGPNCVRGVCLEGKFSCKVSG